MPKPKPDTPLGDGRARRGGGGRGVAWGTCAGKQDTRCDGGKRQGPCAQRGPYFPLRFTSPHVRARAHAQGEPCDVPLAGAESVQLAAALVAALGHAARHTAAAAAARGAPPPPPPARPLVLSVLPSGGGYGGGLSLTFAAFQGDAAAALAVADANSHGAIRVVLTGYVRPAIHGLHIGGLQAPGAAGS